MEGRPTLASVYGRKRETRQEYATRRVQEYQRTFAADEDFAWEDLLSTFRFAGQQYDTGTQVAA